MRQVYRIDEQGYFVEPVILRDDEQILEDCTVLELPEGLFRARFVNGEWVEDATSEEIEELTRVPERQPSEVELLQRDNATLLMQVAEVTAQNEQQAGDMAFMLMKNAELEAQLAQTFQEQAALLIELTTKGVL